MLAPLPAPVVFGALYTLGWSGRDPVIFFLMCVSFGYMLSLTGTAALALSLLFLGRSRPVGLALSILLGVVLGCIGYASFLIVGWNSRDPDSGLPEGTLLAYFLRNWNDPFAWIFIVCGLAAAFFHHVLTLRFVAPEPAVGRSASAPV